MILLLLSYIQFSKIEKVARLWAEKEWGYKEICEVMPYYSLNGDITAYAFIFSDRKRDVEEYLRRYPYRTEESRDYIRLRTGDRIFGTVVVSATEENPPVLEVDNCLPPYYTRRHFVKERKVPLIYLGPPFQWYRLGEELIDIRDGSIITVEKLRERISQKEKILSMNQEELWRRYDFNDRVNTVEYNKVEGVPPLIWSYGCSPTSSAMIMWYWDMHGFDKLVDYFFDRFDTVEKNFDTGVPNVQQELAIAMGTDTLRGSSYLPGIREGHVRVGAKNGYTIYSQLYNTNSSGAWGIVKGEIDDGRPTHWTVGYYSGPGHSLCAIGYELTDTGEKFFIVYNTWDLSEHKWALDTDEYFTDGVVTVEPQDPVDYNIDILSPVSEATLYRGFTYPVKFITSGEFSSIHIWLSPDSGGRPWEWEGLGDTDGDVYIWDIPADFPYDEVRINAEMYSGELKGAEGLRYHLNFEDLKYEGFVEPHHIPASYINGLFFSYPYIFFGINNKLYKYIIQDGEPLPLRVIEVDGTIRDISFDGDRIYVLTTLGDILIYTEEGDFVKKIEHSGGNGGEKVFIYNDYIISLIRGEGIKVYNKESFSLESTLEFLLIGTGGEIIGDTLYITGRGGVMVCGLDSLPLIKKIDTLKVGSCYDMAKIDRYLYITRGNKPLLRYDLTTGDTTTPGALADLGSVYKIESTGDYLYIPDRNDTLHVFEQKEGNLERVKKYFLSPGFAGATLHSNIYFVVPTSTGIFIDRMEYGGIVSHSQTLDKIKIIPLRRGVKLSANSYGKMSVFDISGRVIYTRMGREFSITYLSPGVYFYIFNTPHENLKGKFLIIK